MGAGTGFNQAPPPGGGGSVVSVSGTPDRVTSTGGTTPVIDISSTFEGTLEKVVNKSTDVDADKASNIKYPSVKSVYDWAVSIFQTLANKDATGGYAGLTLFKINFKNAANTFTSFFTNSNSASRTYTFQNRDGTIADDTDLALKAPLASPTFTGSPTAPTQSADDNSTKIATTAYADAKVIDSIADSDTTHAPSRNSVYDALALKEPISNQASISASAIDWNVTHSYKTLGANTTFTFSNAANAKTIIVAITNTASNYTVTWPTVDWGAGGAPVQRTGANTDIYTFVQINGTIYGSVRQ